MTPEDHSASPQQPKPQRILACVLCQQRKVKCDRRFPCANCVKARVQCVPATLTKPRRRRRFAERDLLDRLHRYEDLLRRNGIPFDALRTDDAGSGLSPQADNNDEVRDEYADAMVEDTPGGSSTIKSETGFAAKNIWHAMSQGFRDHGEDTDSSDDDLRETTVRKALNQTATNDDYLLFGPAAAGIELSALHPDPVRIFKLWQTFLNNVNPLLKIVHVPTIQGHLIEATSNLASIDPSLEALMFGIYCVSILTLSNSECQNMLSTSKEEAMAQYQTGCQQALWKSGFLRSSERNCLTAFYLYLISIRTDTQPQSLSAMLGIAIRVAHRMGIHFEAILAKCDILEAEMRRRLWWSLVLFDARVGEMANWKASTLDPTWDCKLPLNVNDADLRADMKRLPTTHGPVTEALFVMVQSELADYLRHASFYLDFTMPALKTISQQLRPSTVPEEDELANLEERIEQQYLRYCDYDDPVQFMTVWKSRAFLARFKLVQFHSQAASSTQHLTETQRDAATASALRMLEYDSKIMTSPLTKGFVWLNNLYFPFVAYNHIIQDLKRRPLWTRVAQAWQIMSENYDAWFESRFRDSVQNPVLVLFAEMILRGWKACEAAHQQIGVILTVPNIVSSLRHLLALKAQADRNAQTGGSADMDNLDFNLLPTQTPEALSYPTPDLPNTGMFPEGNAVTTPDFFAGMPGQQSATGHMYQWTGSMLGGWPGWGGY